MNKSGDKCARCGEYKPLTEFWRKTLSKIGRERMCRTCKNVSRRNGPKRAPRVRKYNSLQRRAHTMAKRAWEKRNSVKVKAQKALRKAVMIGNVEKPDQCQDCAQNKPLHGHHDDYSQPLAVRWLCAACHKKVHHANAKRN